MRKTIILLTTGLAAVLATLPADAGIFNKKSRRELERENRQLRERLDALQQEITWYQNDINERDSLRNELVSLYEENENKLAAGMTSADYTPEVTDSLLSVWYLHRQSRENRQGTGYNMDSVHFTTLVPDQVLIERLEKMNSFIRLPYNETVKNYMILYSEKMPVKMGQILGLAQFYMPVFEETFRKYDLPLELKYVAIIESALNPRAVSRAGATGMWQFMYPTARNYGLKIDSYIDERMDHYASVDAAARYLRDAYRIFGDWSLAISSYNCGSGNVNKAIKRSGSRDFWSIYEYLPRETRGYVPAMVGAMYAMNYAKEYGLEPAPVQIPAHIDTFHVKKNLHFRQVSEMIGIPLDDIRDLNPQYYRDIVPGKQGEQVFRLPFNYSADFIDLQDTIYRYKAQEMFSAQVDDGRGRASVSSPGTTVRQGGTGAWVYYTVKRGDNLGKIARKYHTTVSNLKKWNGLRNDNIREGQRLKVGKR